ncbi:MAG: hypothetical protein NWE92_10710 [Candidatus Bathyarchaeota archaeon]|nr:hypothetical protein [Candidatus Bathyarchaeota archaeon]
MQKLGVLCLILVLSLLIVYTLQVTRANPSGYDFFFGNRPAPANVAPPRITIVTPIANADYSNGTLNVSITVTDPKGHNYNMYTLGVSYKGDWIQEYVSVVGKKTGDITQFDFNITDIPFGPHTLTVAAGADGEILKDGLHEYNCWLKSNSSVNFEMYTTPKISYPSQNATLTNSSFPLNITVDHPVNNVFYAVDGQEKVPITGNTTLTGLSNGKHYIIAYTEEPSGRIDASETVFFNVNIPNDPMFTMIIVASLAVIISVILLGALIAIRKVNRNN